MSTVNKCDVTAKPIWLMSPIFLWRHCILFTAVSNYQLPVAYSCQCVTVNSTLYTDWLCILGCNCTYFFNTKYLYDCFHVAFHVLFDFNDHYIYEENMKQGLAQSIVCTLTEKGVLAPVILSILCKNEWHCYLGKICFIVSKRTELWREVEMNTTVAFSDKTAR